MIFFTKKIKPYPINTYEEGAIVGCAHPAEKVKLKYHRVNNIGEPFEASAQSWLCECGAKVKPTIFKEIK